MEGHYLRMKNGPSAVAPALMEGGAVDLRERADAIYRSESRRVLATLIRLLGDFDLAEEALQDAFRAALEQWPREGMPANPPAWLVSTGRLKAIDAVRRGARFEPLPPDSDERLVAEAGDPSEWEDEGPRRRPPASHLHLLPSGPGAGGPGGAERRLDRGGRQRPPNAQTPMKR